MTSYERGQSHDIKTILVLKGGHLISGGLSTDIAIYRLDNTGRYYKNNQRFQQRQIQDDEQYKARKIRHITNLPQHQIYHVANDLKNKKVVLVQRQNQINLVQMQSGIYQNLIEINTQDQQILCSQINKNSSMIGYSTLQETNIFLVKQDLSIQKIQKLEAVQIMLIKEQNIYYINLKSQLCIFDLIEQSKYFIIKETIIIEQLKKTLYDFYEMNDKYIIFGSKLENQIIVIKDNQIYYRVPQVQGFVNGFNNFSIFQDTLWIVFDNNKFIAFDLIQKQMTQWSLNNMNKFPQYYLNHYNKLCGIFQIENNKIIVYCPFFYSIIDLEKPIPKEVYRDGKDSKTSVTFQLLRRQNPILFFNFYQKELILIENTWQQLLKEMPGAVNTRNFGF